MKGLGEGKGGDMRREITAERAGTVERRLAPSGAGWHCRAQAGTVGVQFC